MAAADLLKLARKGKIDELETAWMEAVEAGVGELEPFLEALRAAVKLGHAQEAESLLWFLVDSLRESGRQHMALKAARRGAEPLPESGLVRELLIDLYGEVYAERPGADELLELTLRSSGLPLDGAAAALNSLLTLTPGCYVLDERRGEVGRVDSLDLEEGGLRVEFEDGRRLYGPGLVGRLERLEDDDFRAMRLFDRERLRELAEQDPEELLRVVLSSLDRRMELRRIRLYLQPVLDSWSRWWSGARSAIRRSSIIGTTGGKSPSLFLRRQPLSHGRRLLRRLKSLGEPEARLAQALHLVREAEQTDQVEPEVLAEVAAELSALAGQGDGRWLLPAAAVAGLLADCSGTSEPAVALSGDQLADALGEPKMLAESVSDEGLLMAVVDHARRQAPALWAQFAAGLVPLVGRRACAGVARRLDSAGEVGAVSEACREVLARADVHVGALAWLWRRCAAGEAPDQVRAPAVAMRLLSELASLVRASDVDEEERGERIAEGRTTLFIRGGEPLREAVAAADPAQRAALKSLGERNPALTDRMRDDMLGMLQELEPELFEEEVPPWEEEVIYSTAEGIERRRAELEHLTQVRIPRVIKEIGQAASFGDISDNAEYQSAVQERARLAERADRIQQEIAEADLITREVAEAEHVTVGSRVRARNMTTGEVETMTFLGPWDAEPEQQIYAYNAPLGGAFMGKEPGDTVVFRLGPEERRYEVLAVEPGV